MLKKILVTIFLALFIFSLGNLCLAADNGEGAATQDNTLNQLFEQTGVTTDKAGYNTGLMERSLPSLIRVIIQTFLGLLGIIFLVLIIYAGFLWMTAGGDEEKVTKAKEIIQRAVIGLIIITAAYAITYFVFSNLPGRDGGGAGIQNQSGGNAGGG